MYVPYIDRCSLLWNKNHIVWNKCGSRSQNLIGVCVVICSSILGVSWGVGCGSDHIGSKGCDKNDCIKELEEPFSTMKSFNSGKIN